MVTFRIKYFILALIIFIVETLIALFLHGGIVRNYIGDILVVILIFCFIRTFFKVSVVKAAVGVLIFAYAVEASQYFNLIKHLGLEKSDIANVIIGHSFGWIDMLAYTLGVSMVILAERMIR
jgi:hypothetical protein